MSGQIRLVDAEALILRGLARLGRQGSNQPAHLVTGTAGEREALFYLRRQGYTVVARRWRTPKLRGDVDLIAWDGEWLCFVEVKSRTGRNPLEPAESAVDEDKKRMLRSMAHAYLRRFPRHLRDSVPVRFDVLSVYLQPSASGRENQFDLSRGAFAWR